MWQFRRNLADIGAAAGFVAKPVVITPQVCRIASRFEAKGDRDLIEWAADILAAGEKSLAVLRRTR